MSKFLLIAALLISPFSYSAEFFIADIDSVACENLNSSTMCVVLLLEGNISSGDEQRLLDAIEDVSLRFKELDISARVGKIHFNSNGGDIYEAMRLGRIIRSNLITTQITHDATCYSACVIAYLGGVLRVPVGPVGIHSFYSESFIGPENFDEASMKYNEVSEDLEQFLFEMRIPRSFLDEMQRVPSSRLKILEYDQLEGLGILGIVPVYEQTDMQ